MTPSVILCALCGQHQGAVLREPGFETLCAHAGEDPARYMGAVVPPIYQNSLFVAPDAETFGIPWDDESRGYGYTRFSNPTTDILETKLAALERTEAARCFGSGMAAVAAVMMHCAKAGDHIVAVETIYGPTRVLLNNYLSRFDIGVTYVQGTDPQQFADALRSNTRLFFLESPSTFVFLLQDLAAVAALAQEKGIFTAIDNSWASPYFQNPADFGMDLTLHSATKYLGGHSDILAGAVMGPKALMEGIKAQEGGLVGGILDPFAAWLMLRGIRTLPLRMERHQSSALAVARFLEEHPRVARVHYPGLPSHPQHDLGRRQMRGCSGLLSFELKDGTQADAYAFVNRLRYFGIGVSWGGFESLAVPTMFGTGRGDFAMASSRAARWGARLHVGLETVEDLLDDLENALA
jgi:cystathionine beta-lyase